MRSICQGERSEAGRRAGRRVNSCSRREQVRRRRTSARVPTRSVVTSERSQAGRRRNDEDKDGDEDDDDEEKVVAEEYAQPLVLWQCSERRRPLGVRRGCSRVPWPRRIVSGSSWGEEVDVGARARSSESSCSSELASVFHELLTDLRRLRGTNKSTTTTTTRLASRSSSSPPPSTTGSSDRR